MGLLKKYENKNILVITDSDLDGISAHLIARYFIQIKAKNFYYEITNDREFKNINYDRIKSSDLDYIIFVDTTPNITLYNSLKSFCKEIHIFDHHVSGKNELGFQDNYYYDIERCGSRIFFDTISKGEKTKKIVQQYISLVDTYDRYLQESLLWKQAKDLSNILFEGINWYDKTITDNERYNDFINTQLDKFNYNNGNFFFTKMEEAKALNGEKKERNALADARRTIKFRLDGERNKYAYIECNSKLSYVCNILLKEYGDNIKYILAYSTFDKDRNKISIRSANDFDCSLLAQIHGGGGHKSASGIEFTNKQFFDKLKKGEVHLL